MSKRTKWSDPTVLVPIIAAAITSIAAPILLGVIPIPDHNGSIPPNKIVENQTEVSSSREQNAPDLE